MVLSAEMHILQKLFTSFKPTLNLLSGNVLVPGGSSSALSLIERLAYKHLVKCDKCQTLGKILTKMQL